MVFKVASQIDVCRANIIVCWRAHGGLVWSACYVPLGQTSRAWLQLCVFDNRAAQDFASVQGITCFVDLVEPITPCDELIQRKLTFLMPAQEHREITVRISRAETAAVAALLIHEKPRV